MSFSSDSSSRETIQAIQFELWPDCNSGCPFCYLNGTKRITKLNEKRKNIADCLNTLKNEELMKDYNAVGLIGGEFFQNQLKDIESNWFQLLCYLKFLLETRKIKEVWIASSLINIKHVYLDTISMLNEIQLNPDQRIMLCTSYDTIGRFDYKFYVDKKDLTDSELEKIARELKSENSELTIDDFKEIVFNNKRMHDSEKEQDWLNEIKHIKDKYKNITIHVQTILTQDVIDKLIENPNYFDFITDLGCMIDFRYPSITRADCPTATVIEDYRSLLLAKYKDFPEHFFIEDRAKFLRFLSVFAEKYGLEKVKNLIHQPEMRSRRLKIYVDNAEIEDRWNDTRDVYLECGHLVDGLCYINDDEHCIYCDIEKFIKNKENV